MRLFVPILMLALATPLTALPASPPRKAPQSQLEIQGEVEIIVTRLPFKVVCPDKANDYVWRVPASWKYTEAEGYINVTQAPEGSHTVGLRTLSIDFKAASTSRKVYELTVNVGKATPPDPGPGPGPDPGPAPTPSTDPFGPGPGGGLKVLMVFDAKAKSTYTSGQLNVLEGQAVRDYLEAKCVPDPRVASWKAYRIWPSTEDASGEDKLWQKVFARPRTAVPWIVIGNGTAGYEGPLPANPEAAVALLRKYAEAK